MRRGHWWRCDWCGRQEQGDDEMPWGWALLVPGDDPEKSVRYEVCSLSCEWWILHGRAS